MNERSRRNRLDDIRRVAFEMRETPIEAPDFTSSILDRVDAERPFLAPSVRRKLPWIRIGLGACVAFAALSIALTYRWAPKTVQAIAQQPAPISDVVQSVEGCASHKFIPRSINVISFGESDATHLLAAMAAAAKLSEFEGRPVEPLGDMGPAPMAVAAAEPLVMPSQVVALRTPGSVAPRADAPLSVQYASSIFPPESVLPSASSRPVIFSADVPRVRVVPTFLEHELDGALLPR